ncbi:MAG: undecaprenyldiphospho-muramoylpentapeptide beta-N-acetylglucosaminyltransferase [Acidobacteriota bacterium]|nr:undecaprenyldiphospho-muramoylpentapeptide beta-N-acetylglucosaminyltransferase [Acidobacteriota bacterium]
MRGYRFLMAGGGTGGHVIPAIAVAHELVREGHEAIFAGTERGAEARLVPAAGFRLEPIRVGGLKNLGLATRIVSVWRLMAETFGLVRRLGEWKPAAVFSMGGYVAGPAVLAALARRVPVVVMEPNAVPGVTNRWIARWVRRALISFEETKRFFPAGRTEVTGLPVREEFFAMAPKAASGEFTVLITGGSQGSQKLNNAARESWPLLRESGLPIRLIHQTGAPMFEELKRDFEGTGLKGEISAFISDMPAAFASADLIVCRTGAGSVSELAAAGKPSVLIPFPFAADDHQLKNAQAFERAGAGILSLDREWNGQRFFEIVKNLYEDRPRLASMGQNARKLAHHGAARRAAQILIDIAATAPKQ